MTRGEKIIEFCHQYCIIPEGDKVGQPVILAEFQKKFIREVYDNPDVTDTAILSIARKNAKALPLDTPVPTPDGFVLMGDLSEGDKVIGSDGRPTRVTLKSEIHKNKDCYRITWDDGSETISSADHQWRVRVGGMGRSWKTVDAEEICRTHKHTKQSIAIPLCKPVNYSEKYLDISPYVLGAWLGDGSSTSSEMYVGAEDLSHFINEMSSELGFDVVVRQDSRPGSCYTLSLYDGVRNCRDKTKLRPRLRALGVLGNKHIPEQYMTASVPQRWALLQGLMDTDGSVSIGGKIPQCTFSQKNKSMCDQVCELARSLGLKASVKHGIQRVNGSPYDYWRVTFNAFNDCPVFRLKRKQGKLSRRPEKESRSCFRYVKSVEKVNSVPCQCIQVEAQDSLYLCGRDYVVTHNTGLIAFLLLAHVVGPEAVQNSRIVSGATSREQAAEVYNLASKCVMLSPKLLEIIKIIPSSKKLIGLPMNVEYQAISAEGKTAHGKSPIVAILDEVGQIRGPRSDFVDAITTAQGAYQNPLLIYISTQAPNDADLFSMLIDDALQNKHPKTVCHVYAADEDAELMDREQWIKANPAMGLFRSESDMLKQAEKASRMPSFENTFRNLNLNQRVSAVSPFVSRGVWEMCGEEPGSMAGRTVFVGLDLSGKTDLTSAVLMSVDDDGYVDVWPYFWTPAQGLDERSKADRQPYDLWVKQGLIRTTPGASIGYDYIVKDLSVIMYECEVGLIGFDRWRIDLFKREMEREGVSFPMEPFGQGYKDMGPAVDQLEEALLNGKLRHGMNPVLTMCAANVQVVKDPSGSRKFDKSKATGRIDGMVALAMAIGIAVKGAQEMGDFDNFLSAPLKL